MAVAHPSVDADLQQYYSIYLLMTEAFLAAREGDLERAKAYLGQVQAIKDSRNPLDSRRLFTREIRREIAIAQRNPTQLREQLSQLPSAKPSGLPRECTSFYNEVRLRMALDEKTVAMALSEKVLSGECRNSPMQEWIEALLRGELAKHKARKGDLKSARQLVEEFDHDWARPDAELPVVQTIEAVREKL